MRIFRTAFVMMALVLGAYGAAHSADVVKPVAVVNGVELSEADLSEEISRILPLETNFHGGVSAEKIKSIRSKAVAALVEKELQYQDALAKGLKLPDAELDKEIGKLREKFKARGDFNKLIEQSGFTEASFRRFVERKILADKIKVRTVDQMIRVTDEMAKEFYEANKAKYFKPEEFRASQILIKVDPSANLEEKAKRKEFAETVLKKLREGADFAQMAAKESEDLSSIKGGDLGSFHAGETLPEFEEAVKVLKMGGISGLVETIYGFHIIKLVDRKEPRQLQFADVKEKIKAQLEEKERERLYNQWMERLKANAKILRPEEG